MDKSPDAFRTISEVGTELDLPQHVLRFWETRFSQIRPLKRSGGRRYYRPDDVELLKAIRHLLYGQGYTIKGVQRMLKERGAKALSAQVLAGSVPVAGFGEAPMPSYQAEPDVPFETSLRGEDTFAEPAAVARVLRHHEPAQDEDELEAEPAGAGAVRFAGQDEDAAQAGARVGLRFEDLHRLKAALFEINEGLRLLKEAVASEE